MTLTGQDWQVAYNDLGDLSGSPVVVDTGAGNETLGFDSDITSFSGSATLGLGTLGEVSGTFSITDDGTQLVVEASGVSALVGAGSAALRLSDAAGTFVFTDDGGAGWAHGNAELLGVPGLALRASLDVEFNNTGASADVPDGTGTRTLADGSLFRIAGAASLKIAHFLDVDGDFSFKKTGSGANRTIEIGVASGSDQRGRDHLRRQHVCRGRQRVRLAAGQRRGPLARRHARAEGQHDRPRDREHADRRRHASPSAPVRKT